MADFNDGVDGKLAFRMRKVNPEQFHTLVKMHLSFELDLNTEDSDGITEKARLKKWGLLSFTKKSKSSVNLEKGTEGVMLSEDGINHLTQLIDYLSKEQNIVQEGIFRRTGKLTRQQDLKTAMSQGVFLDLDDGRFSVHDCASVLKGFLAELSEPLLTDLHYPAHCQIAELCSLDAKTNDARLLSSLQLLLLLLPPPNRILLKAILTLLNKTASYEHSNKMNSDTLATLFTPHLLCPRKLSPEALHINSQNLSCLVAFMIRKGTELFEIPPKLATDIRAYWMEQERKLLSPKKTDLNESVPDATSTAHTVFSFVDRKLTAKANSTQDTQAALAQLYAHIQAMPESAKKRRLVKQFNKENGQGTPRHVKNCKTKSLGDSIKKHIFQKKILGHKKFVDINIGCNFTRSSSEENILSTSPMVKNRFRNVYAVHTSTPSSLLRRSLATNDYLLTPITNNDRSMSPITQSATKMTKAMQETMMTPRSRKPVMIVSTSNLCNLVTGHNGCDLRGSNLDNMVGAINNCASILEESQTYNSTDNALAHAKDVEIKENNVLDTLEKHSCVQSVAHCCACTQQSSMSITSTFREYLLSRSVLTASPVDLSFTSRTGDFEQSESDLNILNDDTLSDSLLRCLDGNQPESDTSGIASGSTNSANNSTEKTEEIPSPRKRGTSLQRNDSKKSARESAVKSTKSEECKHKLRDESTLNPTKMKDSFQETSF
ncbi:PREDICTED: rho GTPase-activating protein 19 isoform X2 [Wasmannia auropunctata]|uniref:rho GTPase-activating protein 19 isoform X2 n=1 Tax=Wasmannia auropunctata TaxID=64793 RepID=UPI0005EF1CF9|nr:PREDICTED: rho GTPase-activating protein 19 isoform X2 [Wasmannia auropunctata]